MPYLSIFCLILIKVKYVKFPTFPIFMKFTSPLFYRLTRK